MPHGIGNTPDLYRQDLSDGPALPIDALGPAWAAWREEERGGKKTKPPLSPRTGGNASNSSPRTWSSKAQAEALRDRLGKGKPKGIGLMLHAPADHPGWRLIGLDLDSCRDDETGDLAWWAPPVVERFATYTEPSPSGTGLRVLAFARDEDVEAVRAQGLILPDARTGGFGAGRKFALSGEHRELALAVERQFYAITERPLPGHDLIRPVSLADLRWLLGEHGPEVQRREGAREAQVGGKRGTAGRDETGNGYGWRFCMAAFLAGADEEAVIAAIAEDQGEAGDWWNRVDDRQHDRVLAGACAAAARRRGEMHKDFDMIEHMDARERDLEAALQEVVFLPPEEGSVAVIAPLRSRERDAADRRAPFSDTWAGARHADLWRGKRLYVSATQQWLEWTGERWVAQTPEDVAADAKTNSAKLYAEAASACAKNPTAENQAMLRKAAALHGSSAALIRMVESARSEPGMHVASPAEFDADPFTLATPSGLVDLRTGAQRPAQPEDMVSKLAGAAYDPRAQAPMWEALVERALPDPEVRAFFQQAMGYALTGATGEEVFFLLYGCGANGKSVIGTVMKAAWGEYAGQFGSALVMKGRSTNEGERMVAALPGLRLAQVDETAAGDVFDGARVKTLSGREAISTRLLHHEVFSFQPTHKLVIRTNHLPGSQDPSDGFWRRCVPIPFTVQIPEEERIPDLDRRIIAQELPGVLAWAVRGAVAWAQEGRLRVPASLRAVAAQYREDTDILGQWLAERTIPDPEGEVRAGLAYADYQQFCEAQGVKYPSQPVFGRELVAQNIRRGTNTARRSYLGFRLRSYSDEDFSDVI